MNGEGNKLEEETEEDDKIQPVVKMRVKPSRTSEVEECDSVLCLNTDQLTCISYQ